MEQNFRVVLPDKNATKKFGVALANCIEHRAVIALVGSLGAGKTTLVQAVAEALAIREIVNSPTFTMLNEYHSGRLALYHLDLYRLLDSSPAPDLLVAEMDGFIHTDMVAMIEWAELLPEFDLAQGDDADRMPAAPAISEPYQLDHLVIKLSMSRLNTPGTQTQGWCSTQLNPGIGQKNGQISDKAAMHKPGEDDQALNQLPVAIDKQQLSKQLSKEMHINKDEEARIACVWPRGPQSSALVARLRSAVAAMLIKS